MIQSQLCCLPATISARLLPPCCLAPRNWPVPTLSLRRWRTNSASAARLPLSWEHRSQARAAAFGSRGDSSKRRKCRVDSWREPYTCNLKQLELLWLWHMVKQCCADATKIVDVSHEAPSVQQGCVETNPNQPKSIMRPTARKRKLISRLRTEESTWMPQQIHRERKTQSKQETHSGTTKAWRSQQYHYVSYLRF